MSKYSVGIDISKDDFHVCASLIDDTQHVKVIRSGTFTNKRAGFQELTKWIQVTCKEKDIPVVVVMEATGVYYENCALYLFSQNWQVAVILPNKAKKYIAAIGMKTKNDKADAKGLSRMGAEQALELWEPLAEFYYHLRGLTRNYEAIQQLITAQKNQLEAAQHGMYPNKLIIQSHKKMIQLLETQLATMRTAITEHIASDSIIAKKVKDVAAIKGVGELTVAVLIAETNGFYLFKNSPQLVSYAGYDVVENQSGKRVGKTKISKKGNGHIRRALHMPALNVVRFHVLVFKNLYVRTVEKHKIKMKSYVAVQKKLLTTIYALWKRGEKFDPKYGQHDTTREMEAEYASQVAMVGL
jgi:transposase